MEFLFNATEDVQHRLPENADIFQAMTIISPSEVYHTQDLTNLAKRFRNIAPVIDSVNTELRKL